MTDNIRLISELFDVGNKKSKAIKDHERQDEEVHGMGMNALFVGSEDNIILDKSIAQKFKTEFVTKLARRSMFVYSSKAEFEACIPQYSTYEDMIKQQETFEDMAAEGKSYIASASADMANTWLERDSRLLEFTDEALAAYKDYKLYTVNLGNGLSYIHKSVQLEQIHRSWKMLKLAGVYAMWDNTDTIDIGHIRDAIYFVEKIGHYLEAYEEYATKESYELLIDFFKSNPDASLTLHDLKKRGFISGSTSLDTRVKELVKLADSFAGADGTVQYANDVMSYKPFEKVGDHMASYIMLKGTKAERVAKAHSGYTSKATTFANLRKLLDNDTAYSPFKFADGVRKNDNIISGATWVALDVDDSDVSIYEMHDILGDTNHHIATTSDPENIYKFRLILEFNNVVDLPVREWKAFGKALGEELGINVDPATFTKSQIMFGYKGAKVLSNLDGEQFDVSNAVKAANQKISEVFNKTKAPTRTQKRSMLDNPMETFSYLFNAKEGEGSLAMYRAYKHAYDLGASLEEVEKLLHDVNYSFWDEPMNDERFEKTILIPMRRMFLKE